MALLERARHLEELHRHLRDASSDRGRLVFVGGEAGIGKTMLVRAFAAGSGAARVLWGSCDPLATPRPLGPLLDMLSDLDGDVGELVWSGAPRERTFRSVLQALASAPKPTLVVIEDAHWADEATRDLLRYLGRRLSDTHVLIVVTYRNDEVGATHPLRIVLGDLAVRADTARMYVTPLSIEGLQALADASEPEVDVRALHARTGGNPFFATEILALGGAGIPESVRDAVLARAGRLDPAARSVLDAAAVVGARLDPDLLLEVAEADPVDLEACLASGALVPVGDALGFRHELSREALASALPPTRRRSYHRRALDALLRRSADGRPEDLATLAHHAEGAADTQAVLHYAPAAARQAALAHAHREAVAQYARALRFAAQCPASLRADLHEALADETSLTDQLATSVAARRAAIDLRRAEGDAVAVAVNLARLSRAHIGLGENAEAERRALEAVSLIEDLPARPETALIQTNWAYLRMLDRDSADALAGGERAAETARAIADMPVLVQALNVVGSARILLGDYEAGRAALEESMHLARAERLDVGVVAAYGNLGSGFGEMYQLEDADRYLREGIVLAHDLDLDFLSTYMLAWQALTWCYRGRWTDAAEVAIGVLKMADLSAISRIMALLALGRIRARRGDPEVGSALRQAAELAEGAGTLQRVGPVRAARAEAAWLAGDVDATIEEARAAYELAERKGHPWFVGELAYWRWKAGDIGGAPATAARPYALQIDGRWREAANAWAELGCPYERARALAEGDASARAEAASIFRELNARPALEALAAVEDTVVVPPVPRGPRPSTRRNPCGLTNRQMDVLELLADGLTNAEIADRMTRSEKTVEHHVSAIFAKLEARNRTEAAQRAGELGIGSRFRDAEPPA